MTLFEFDDVDLLTYHFTYEVSDMVYAAWEKSKNRGNMFDFSAFSLEVIKNCILKFYRMYAEHEQEWVNLKYYAEHLEITDITAIKKAYILLDQACILIFEGRKPHFNPLL